MKIQHFWYKEFSGQFLELSESQKNMICFVSKNLNNDPIRIYSGAVNGIEIGDSVHSLIYCTEYAHYNIFEDTLVVLDQKGNLKIFSLDNMKMVAINHLITQDIK